MTDDFQALINRYRARMAVLRAAFGRDGCLHAISTRDPSYAILLSRNGSSEAPWRVTSFRSGEPVGIRNMIIWKAGRLFRTVSLSSPVPISS
jgi:hypothetical protein